MLPVWLVWQQRKQRPRARRWHSHETAMDGGPQVSGCWEKKKLQVSCFSKQKLNFVVILHVVDIVVMLCFLVTSTIL